MPIHPEDLQVCVHPLNLIWRPLCNQFLSINRYSTINTCWSYNIP